MPAKCRVLQSGPRASRGIQNTTGIWGATWCTDGPAHTRIISVRKHTHGRTAFHQQEKGYIRHKRQVQQRNYQNGRIILTRQKLNISRPQSLSKINTNRNRHWRRKTRSVYRRKYNKSNRIRNKIGRTTVQLQSTSSQFQR